MILTEQKTNVQTSLTGESQAFSIATNAKAFRILVDGIYSDNIGSIARELMSNCWDAHVRRGVLDLPFEVRLPNSLNPTFSVRDYGCSMEHEFVMRSYSTLFESSKSASNNEVGAFGLGAKVFLAYTDACTLNCWLNGEMRAYTITLNEHGVPTVTLVHRGPSTEKQGTEVTFAVKRDDFQAFSRAVSRASFGFDVLPKIIGGDITVPSPMHEGKGWRLYQGQGNNGLTQVSVRQGCAVYPTQISSGLPYAYQMIVDMPIGTVSVTASREQLAMTHNERQDLIARGESCLREFQTQIQAEYHKLTTPIAKAKYAYLNRDIIGGTRGQFPTFVKLPFSLPLVQTVRGQAGLHQTEYDMFNVQSLEKLRLLLDDGTKVPRLKKRLNAYVRHHNVYLTDDPVKYKEAAVALDLTPHQKMRVADIPDVAVTPRGAGTGAPRKVITSTRVWAFAESTLAWTTDRTTGVWNRRTDHPMGWDPHRTEAGKFITKLIPTPGLLFLTEKEHARAITKGTIDPDNRLDLVVKRALDTPTHHAGARAHEFLRVFNAVPVHSRRQMVKKAGVTDAPMDSGLFQLYSYVFPSKVHDATLGATQKRAALANKYPLLFGYDQDAIDKYIQMCDLAVGPVL